MNQANKLLAIKLIHTLIWAFFVAIIIFILYSGIIDRITIYTWIGIGLIIGEGLVLWTFGMSCPLTVVARRYCDSEKENFDIFLPLWLAKNNKVVFTSIFFVGLLVVLYRVLS